MTEEGPRGASEVDCGQRLASALTALVAVATRCGRRGYRLSGLVGTCLAVGREQHDATVEREGVDFNVEAGAILVREGHSDSGPGPAFLAVGRIELADGVGVEALARAVGAGFGVLYGVILAIAGRLARGISDSP